MTSTLLIISILLLLLPYSSVCQVANDSIENAIALKINDAPHLSNTTNCTVQWQCVNESLTGKCIEYHNDQWFTFTTDTSNVYFINIANQNCRDQRGVQLVVIDGVRCDTATYEIETCVSLANQDDIFVKLDSLKKNHTYLLNIDGYLHDFCHFTLQVSDKASGIPVEQTQGNIAKLNIENKEGYIDLKWRVSDKLGRKLYSYQVFRYFLEDTKSKKIAIIPHQMNARGLSKLAYAFKDTLKEGGRYEYKIIGETVDGKKFLLASEEIDHDIKNETISLALDFKDNTPITILIKDRATNRILIRADFIYNKNSSRIFYPINNYLKQGVEHFEVMVINGKTNQTEYYYFNRR